MLPVYPGARVEKIRGGLRLMPSPPPVKRKGVVPEPEPAPVNRTPKKAAELPAAPLISEDALAQVQSVAPGWDKYFLAARYKEWMQGREHPNPDAAFVGWVKRFTKGKAP